METTQSFFKVLLNSDVILATVRLWEHWDDSSQNRRIVGNWKGPFKGDLGQPFSSGGQLSRPHKGWNPLVGILPFLLPWVSTMPLISRASHRQPVPVWLLSSSWQEHCSVLLCASQSLTDIIPISSCHPLHFSQSPPSSGMSIHIFPCYSKVIHPNLFFLPASCQLFSPPITFSNN